MGPMVKEERMRWARWRGAPMAFLLAAISWSSACLLAPPAGAAPSISGPSPAPRLASPDWQALHPAHAPSPRAAFAMAYDPSSKRVVLFGGYDAAGYLQETW